MRGTWQNTRSSSCFSEDGGKTYYDINEDQPWWRRWLLRRWYRLIGSDRRSWMRTHRTEPAEPRDLLED